MIKRIVKNIGILLIIIIEIVRAFINISPQFGAFLDDLYDDQIKIVEGLKFLITGEYQIELEQNMRDNPLKGLVEVGAPVELIDH